VRSWRVPSNVAARYDVTTRNTPTARKQDQAVAEKANPLKELLDDLAGDLV
jgi:hypothetical protein